MAAKKAAKKPARKPAKKPAKQVRENGRPSARAKAKAPAAGRSSRRSNSDAALDVVEERLQEYANRGVFTGFGPGPARGGKPTFQFRWYYDQPMQLTVDTAKNVLTFHNVMPEVHAGSEMYRDLKRVLASMHSDEFPEYCRVDKARAELSCSSRGGLLSISLHVKKNDYEYGINRVVNAVDDVFQHVKGAWESYLVEQFHVPEE